MTPVEMFGLTEFPRIGDLPYFLTLAPYHSCWFRLQQSPGAPIAARLAPEATSVARHAAGVLHGSGVGDAARRQRPNADRARGAGAVPRSASGGSPARLASIRAARFVDWGLLRRGDHPMFLTIVEVEYKDAGANATSCR